MSFLGSCVKPKLIIQGANDTFGTRESVEAFFATLPDPKRLVIIEGVDHFFSGKLGEVGAALDAWLNAPSEF